MSKTNYVLAEDPAVDLAVVEAEVEELEEYIIKSDIYRTVRVRTPSGDQMIQMSGGDLLTRLFRLAGEAERLAPDQRARLQELRQRAEQVIYSLRTRFHKLLNREIKTRLDSLSWYLDETAGDPKRSRGDYPFEIRNRQRIDAMVRELGDDLEPELKRELNRIDERIRMIVRPGTFVWDSRLEPVFPRERFWYLYVTP
ncbi:MAG: hypothetical protein H3C34_14510 [Caldilineaceae bacterium]|nr:hypothetical protein [Caldilineaceae bacterium]